MIEIDSFTPEDVTYVAANLTEADELEITTAGGQTPQEALEWAIKVSSDSFAVFPILDSVRHAPVALFGIVPDTQRSPGMAVIWLVSTPMLLSTSRSILHDAKQWIAEWLVQYPKGLHNLVDSRNERHIRWLKKMGAVFIPEFGKTVRGVPFLYFIIGPRGKADALQLLTDLASKQEPVV
jgi:hypothetical protein